MTAEEWFSVFNEKYGDDFNWTIIPFTNHYFVEELKRELGDEAQNKSIYPIAKCDSKDDVLFLFDGEYRIYHLTYSDKNLEGWPRYKGYSDLSSAMKFIEKEYVEEYK